jgi:hypothetical protein
MYSKIFVDFLRNMLIIHETVRPDFVDLKEIIDHNVKI